MALLNKTYFKQNKEFLFFNIFETINRVLGIISTYFLSRILIDSLGEFLYYQSIYTIMAAVALFSTEYVNLVKYKTDTEYINSEYFFSVVQVRFILTLIVLIFSFFLNFYFNSFSFLPYSIALLIISVVSFDFVLLSERKLLYYGLIRFLSQLSNIILLLLFYNKIIDKYYITYSQLLQTLVLSVGVFFTVIFLMGKNIQWINALIFNKTRIIQTFRDIWKFFIIKQFIIFIGGIDLIILSFNGFNFERNIFAEGQRLSYIFYPFITFYISYSLNLVSVNQFTKQLFYLCIILLCLSPIYTALLFGKTSSDNLLYYNFFIILIFFQSILDKENTEVLISDNNYQTSLSGFNIKYFIVSTIIIAGVYTLLKGLNIYFYITIFIFKLLIYLGSYKIKFKASNNKSIFYIILVAFLNILLYSINYYTLLFMWYSQITENLLNFLN